MFVRSAPGLVRRAPGLSKSLCVGLILLAASSAYAASFAGPSVMRLNESAEFNGGGFAANSAVSISVTAPGGAEAHFSTVVGANGKLVYQVAAKTPGVHTVKVLNSSGRTLATARFVAMQ